MNGPHINNNVIIFICLSINTCIYYVCVRTYRANDLYTSITRLYITMYLVLFVHKSYTYILLCSYIKMLSETVKGEYDRLGLCRKSLKFTLYIQIINLSPASSRKMPVLTYC